MEFTFTALKSPSYHFQINKHSCNPQPKSYGLSATMLASIGNLTESKTNQSFLKSLPKLSLEAPAPSLASFSKFLFKSIFYIIYCDMIIKPSKRNFNLMQPYTFKYYT